MNMKTTMTGTKLKKAIARLARDESGQSTTEYVLLLFFVVMAVKSVGGTLKDRLGSLVGKAFTNADEAVESID